MLWGTTIFLATTLYVFPLKLHLSRVFHVHKVRIGLEMKEARIKVILLDESSTLQKWEQPCQTSMPILLEVVKEMKQAVNNYLTLLISSKKSIHVKGLELTEYSDPEEVAKDSISGFIQDTVELNKKHIRNEKRKINYPKESKKVKK